MARQATPRALDLDLADLPPAMRWREWMGRVEAVIFASPDPVSRETLARVVGRDCNLDLIINDIRDELKGRPYELVSLATGWQYRTRTAYADAIRSARSLSHETQALSKTDMLVLCAIAYFQPITRSELSQITGKTISRDVIATLRRLDLIAAGPRSPEAGAPYTYVTTGHFLDHFGYQTLRDMPDMEMLEEAGLLSKDALLAGEFPDVAADELSTENTPDEKVMED